MAEVDAQPRDLEALAVRAQGGARHRGDADVAVQHPDQRVEEVGGDHGVVVEQQHRLARRPRARRGCRRCCRRRSRAFSRQRQNLLVGKAGADARDRIVARAVVDDQHPGAAEVGRAQALEAGDGVVGPLPVEDDDGHVRGGDARSAQIDAPHREARLHARMEQRRGGGGEAQAADDACRIAEAVGPQRALERLPAAGLQAEGDVEGAAPASSGST